MEAFLDEGARRGKSPLTLRAHAAVFHALQADTGVATLDQLTKDTLRAWVDRCGRPQVVSHQAPKVLKPATIRHRIKLMKAFARWLQAEGFPVNSSVFRVEPPKLPTRTVEPVTLTEQTQLLKACSGCKPKAIRDNLMIRVLFTTGVRVSELCPAALRGHPDLSHREHDAPRPWQRQQRPPSGTARCRSRQGPARLRNPAASGRSGVRAHSAGGRGPPGDVGQLNLAGLRHVYPRLGWHTYATNFLRAGGHELMLQRLLGHTSLEMTRRYVQFTEADLLQAPRVADPGAERAARVL